MVRYSKFDSRSSFGTWVGTGLQGGGPASTTGSGGGGGGGGGTRLKGEGSGFSIWASQATSESSAIVASRGTRDMASFRDYTLRCCAPPPPCLRSVVRLWIRWAAGRCPALD